jgi:hypothetical protein
MASTTMDSTCPARLRKGHYGRDCIEVAMRQFVENGIATVDEILNWQEQFADEVQRAVAQAQQEAAPDPYHEDWTALSTRFPLPYNPSNPANPFSRERDLHRCHPRGAGNPAA